MHLSPKTQQAVVTTTATACSFRCVRVLTQAFAHACTIPRCQGTFIMGPSGQGRLSLPGEVARNTENIKVIEQVSGWKEGRAETKVKALEGQDLESQTSLPSGPEMLPMSRPTQADDTIQR